MTDYIVVVDGVSAGKHIAPAARKRGYRCLHVKSREKYNEFFESGFSTEGFEANFIFNETTIEKLRPYRPVAVFTGSEFSPAVTDRIAYALGLPGNDTAYSFLKRDKFAMQEFVRAAGLESTKQTLVSTVEEAIAWATEHNDWPIVLKPNKSMATDGVKFCHSIDDIRSYFAQYHGTTDLLGSVNSQFLMQEFLVGSEYIANFVSYGGKHVTTEVWELQKRRRPGYGYIYDNDLLIDAEHPQFKVIEAYAHRVLDALRVTYGPIHMEIMLTQRGPVLIEMGARLQGSTSFNALSRCLEHHQLDRLLSILEHPTPYTWGDWPAYYLQNHLMWVQLISEQEGVLKEIPLLESLKGLQSWYEVGLYHQPGASIRKTVDLLSSPGSIFLVNSTVEGLRRDLEAIRAIERNGGYVTA